MASPYASEYPLFTTITCLEWKHLLTEDRFKDIIISSLEYLVKKQRVTICSFVIMNNHLHLVWQMVGDSRREDVQRDFLKYTAQQILKVLRSEQSPWLEEIRVRAIDRKYQVWERRALHIPLWSAKALWQKIRYIHENPVRAGLSRQEEEYRYSSATFYYLNKKDWSFLTHVDG